MFVVKPLASFAHTPVVLVGGLAGSGKSTVSQSAAEDLQLLHLEVDLPGTDGINFHSLRSEWDAFHLRNAGERLAAEIKKRSEAAGRRSAMPVIPEQHEVHARPDRRGEGGGYGGRDRVGEPGGLLTRFPGPRAGDRARLRRATVA